MARLGILFPGQGAQHPGMGRPLWERFAVVRGIFAEASDVLGRDVQALCFDSSEEDLRETDLAQPALYVVGYAGWLALGEVLGDDLEVVVGAGHSLGEYTALAAAQSYSFADGLRLVAERGRLMRRAGDDAAGVMVAIIGLNGEGVEEVCASVRTRCGPHDLVVVANDNAPGQIVISGTPAAVELASQSARERGARRVVPLATSGAFHSPLMETVAVALSQAIESTAIIRSAHPIIANSTALPIQEPAEIRAELSQQLSARVRWVDSVRRMKDYQCDALVDVGPGQVVAGLARRIDSSLTVLSIGDGDQVDAVVQSL